ncbi:MAG TPA: hypothetical protein VIG86_07815 [Candidatus Dormibacteraeota bacterium]|jgi:hypothetical protein
MQVNEPLLAGLGFIAAVVVTLVDGRNAVSYASIAAGLGVAPSVGEIYGADGALLLIAVALLAALIGPLSRALSRRVSWMAGVDPVVPVVAGREALFGPRSIRVAAGAAVLPAASWVSFNVPLGSASTVTGVLFAAALVWGCGAMRLLTARTLVDVASGVAAVGLGAAAAWLIAGGVEALAGAMAAASLAPGVAITAGWLGGRHAGVGAVARTTT